MNRRGLGGRDRQARSGIVLIEKTSLFSPTPLIDEFLGDLIKSLAQIENQDHAYYLGPKRPR
jgi:hypothetical protein